MEYSSAIKRMKFFPFAPTWMDLEGIMLLEVRQRKTNTIRYHLYVESKKYNKLVYITKKQRTHTENKLVVTNGESEGGGAI